MKAKVINKNGRDKAFIGAIVGTVGSIAGGIISGKKKKKAEEAAFAQAQEEQTQQDGINEAAALSSSYGNQDYVNDYQKKITLKNGGKVKNNTSEFGDRVTKAKSNSHTSREKANFGSLVGGITKGFKTELSTSFNKENIGGTIGAIGYGINNAISASKGGTSMPMLTPASVNTANATMTNRQIADEANAKRFIKKNGGRKKAFLGDAGGGLGTLVSSLFQKSDAPKTIKKSDGASFNAPKTGLAANSYQLDENGMPITAVSPVGGVPVSPTALPPNEYRDRIAQAKFGTRRRNKSK